MTDQAAVRAAIDGFEETDGPIDILVNNAGVQHRAPLEDFPAEEFERLMQTNVSSVFHVGQACARHMIRRGRGKIINVASVNALLARYSIAPVHGDEGRGGEPHQGHGDRLGAARPQLQRHRARLHAHAAQRAALVGPGVQRLAGEADAGGTLGRGRGARRRLRLPRLGRLVSFVNGHVLYVDGGIAAAL